MEQPLAETLRRLKAHSGEQDLNSRQLAAETAMPEDVVETLLRGEEPPATTVEERVCARIAALRSAHLDTTGKKPSDLVSEVHAALDISKEWVRKLLNGQKVPNVALLHGLADFFKVEGGEAFFTAPPADALNRVLEGRLAKYETPAPDPVQALMERYGVVATDLRSHGALTPEQLETLLAGVIKSVMPTEGEPPR
ncbi:hypothetical protein KVH27_35485 [Streptomyces olivaceus]|uniref:hypothetical protein n=1 Tax=Streptomyces olivaceus TaxID=47716 RepID=UPI001CCC5C60|nr:hypothetical protein [Streptomyces olivaceus]MBZ6253654.1 hypothetical protein [Streptomyces olivaceus]